MAHSLRNSAPAISVVLLTPDRYETVRKTLGHLRAQTIRDRMEVLLVAPSVHNLGLDESVKEGFWQFRLIEVGEIQRPAEAKALAVRQASAPIVAFAEDHCYPEPGWAAALLAAHEQGWAAVGPIMRNANPGTALSWTGLVLNYGCCMRASATQSATSLPWHNTSYRRDRLLEYGDELASMLIAEGLLLDDLRAKGHRLCLEPAAQTFHVNVSLLWSWVRLMFWGGRLFGALRAEKKHWSVWRRWLYVGGAPVIPLVRLWRALRTIYRLRRQREFIPRLLPSMIAGLVPHALGEAVGYALGIGFAEEHYARFELGRRHHVTADDRRFMLGD